MGGDGGRRPNTPGIVVLLTDSTSSDEVKDSVVAIKGVVDRVIVIGLGYAYDDLELKTVASHPAETNFFEIEESRDLSNFVATVSDEICQTDVGSRGNFLVLKRRLRFRCKTHAREQDVKTIV